MSQEKLDVYQSTNYAALTGKLTWKQVLELANARIKSRIDLQKKEEPASVEDRKAAETSLLELSFIPTPTIITKLDTGSSLATKWVPTDALATADTLTLPKVPELWDLARALPPIAPKVIQASGNEVGEVNVDTLINQIRAEKDINRKIALVLPMIWKHLWLSLPTELSKPDSQKLVRSWEWQVRVVNIRGISSILGDIDTANLAHKSWGKEIPASPELWKIIGLLLEDITPKYEPWKKPLVTFNNYYQLEDLSRILNWGLWFGVDLPVNDIISTFARANIKDRFLLGIKEFTSAQKDEVKALLKTYTWWVDSPEWVYNTIIARMKVWWNMQSIIAKLMIAMWWEYEIKWKELQQRINRWDLQGYTSRVS